MHKFETLNKEKGVRDLTRHKLDDATDEILQHYGVSGMKWDVRRTPEQLEAARAAAAENELPENSSSTDDGDGFLDDMMDSLSKNLEKMGDKIDDIGDDIKKKGMSVLVGIFGKGGDGKWKPAKFDKKATEKFKQNVKDQKPNQMEAKAKAQLKTMSKTEQRRAKQPVRKVYKNSSTPTSRTSETSITRKGFLGIPVTSTKKTTSYVTKEKLK